MNTGARSQRGDTMIEVLVTIIIIAVGVLGTAALQVTTLKNLSSSHSASIAGIVASDFGERMRATAAAIRAEDNDNDGWPDNNLNLAITDAYEHKTAPETYGDCAVQACTHTQMATYDIGTWWDEMNQVLPRAEARVERNPGTNTYVVTVHWDEDRSGSNGTQCPPQSDADKECYQLEVSL